jgi:4-hydroxybenzoate polyprenyltransferase
LNGFETVGSIREYGRLIRPYGILFLGFTPVFGALCNGQFDGFHLAVLLVIGLLIHVFTFVQNDYYDVEVDRQSKYVDSRPLTAGAITRKQAFILYLCVFLFSVIFTVVFLFTLRSMAMLFVSFFLVTLYNKYSKRISGMECVLGAGVFTTGIFGALTVSDSVAPLVLIISSVGFLQWMFSVGVSANLKDVEFDTKLGIRTTPVIFGVKAEGKILKKPVVFILYAYGVKIAHLLVAFSPFLLGYTSLLVFGFPIPVVSFLLIGSIIMITTYGVLSSSLEKRDRMLRYEGIQEGFSLLLIPCVLLSYLVDHFGGFYTVLLFLVMILWPLFILRVLYGKTLIPLE